MKVEKKDLLKSAAAGIISQEQAINVWEFLDSRTETRPGFTGLNVMYYLGALVIISALT
ncbi:MAG: hypothetical protein JXA71_00705 [Chitinispirillaceae bacterium]|nr:hypothetical protein [Chitinispirillaceae bacterium]